MKPNCKVCMYYYVTWNNKQPHGCKLYGFKSLQIPSVVIRVQTREDCNGFSPKKKKAVH